MSAESDSETLGAPLTLDDVVRLEEAADALVRAGEYDHAIALWALALKVRFSFGIPPWERAER